MKNGYTGSDKMYQAASGAIEKSRGATQKGTTNTDNISQGIEVVKNNSQDGRDCLV